MSIHKFPRLKVFFTEFGTPRLDGLEARHQDWKFAANTHWSIEAFLPVCNMFLVYSSIPDSFSARVFGGLASIYFLHVRILGSTIFWLFEKMSRIEIGTLFLGGRNEHWKAPSSNNRWLEESSPTLSTSRFANKKSFSKIINTRHKKYPPGN